MSEVLPRSYANATPKRRLRSVIGAYVALTKPRVIELLLVTTVPAMILAEEGLPNLGLITAVLVGGALALLLGEWLLWSRAGWSGAGLRGLRGRTGRSAPR